MTDPETQQRLADEFDRKLADILATGQTYHDRKTGEVHKGEPSAAMMSVIRGRLKDCGVTASKRVPGTGASALELAARRHFTLRMAAGAEGMTLPPVDVEGEDPRLMTHDTHPQPWKELPNDAAGYLKKLRQCPDFYVRELFRDRQLLDYGEIEDAEADMIRWAALGPPKRGVLAMRGLGKSYMITSALTTWNLFCDRDCKILILSKAEKAAKSTLHLIRQWIDSVWWLHDLSPGNARDIIDHATAFEVAGATESRSAAVTAVGIESQLPNLRAHKVYPDDVETPENTDTIDAREKLDARLRELVAIASYGKKEICYVGTYHHETESVYPKLAARGYAFRSYPMVLPSPDEKVLELAPPIKARLEAGEAPGSLVFPHRHSLDDVATYQAEGRTWWLMQYVLCCSVGDVCRYPLRLEDLIVPDIDFNPQAIPTWIKWGRTSHTGLSTARQDIRFLGFEGDHIHRQIQYSTETKPALETIVYVDPSGRGVDEIAAAGGSFLNGFVWVHDVLGWQDGYSTDTLESIVGFARRIRASRILVEDNFGQGMLGQLLLPIIIRMSVRRGDVESMPEGWTCAVETIRSAGQKEARICDVLEPAAAQHRLVVAPEALEHPQNGKLVYALQHQYTRITRQRDSLKHDDKLEALAGLVAAFTERLGFDHENVAARDSERARKERIRQLQKKYRIAITPSGWCKTYPTSSLPNG